jgi:hypothetical protein
VREVPGSDPGAALLLSVMRGIRFSLAKRPLEEGKMCNVCVAELSVSCLGGRGFILATAGLEFARGWEIIVRTYCACDLFSLLIDVRLTWRS